MRQYTSSRHAATALGTITGPSIRPLGSASSVFSKLDCRRELAAALEADWPRKNLQQHWPSSQKSLLCSNAAGQHEAARLSCLVLGSGAAAGLAGRAGAQSGGAVGCWWVALLPRCLQLPRQPQQLTGSCRRGAEGSSSFVSADPDDPKFIVSLFDEGERCTAGIAARRCSSSGW